MKRSWTRKSGLELMRWRLAFSNHRKTLHCFAVLKKYFSAFRCYFYIRAQLPLPFMLGTLISPEISTRCEEKCRNGIRSFPYGRVEVFLREFHEILMDWKPYRVWLLEKLFLALFSSGFPRKSGCGMINRVSAEQQRTTSSTVRQIFNNSFSGLDKKRTKTRKNPTDLARRFQLQGERRLGLIKAINHIIN